MRSPVLAQVSPGFHFPAILHHRPYLRCFPMSRARFRGIVSGPPSLTSSWLTISRLDGPCRLYHRPFRPPSKVIVGPTMPRCCLYPLCQRLRVSCRCRGRYPARYHPETQRISGGMGSRWSVRRCAIFYAGGSNRWWSHRPSIRQTHRLGRQSSIRS